MVRVAVVGGAGIVGSVAVRDLAAAKDVQEVIVGDINVEKAKAVAKTIGSDKVRAAHVDLLDRASLERTLKEVDVALNGAWYEYNMDVMKAAMAAGIDLVDFGGLYHMTNKQLDLHQEVEKAGITVIPGCGEDPGITNVMARLAADGMDRVQALHIRDGDRDLGPVPPLFKFSIRTILDEFTFDAAVFEEGKYKFIPPLSRSETVRFPDPVGDVTCYATIHSELATLPKYIGKGVRTVDFMVSEPYEIFRMLSGLGFLSSEERKVAGVRLKPKEFSVAVLSKLQSNAKEVGEVKDATCIQVEAIGERKGEAVRHTLYALTLAQPGGVHAMAYLTGVPASIGVQLLARGRAKGPGVVPPEAAFDPREFLGELGKRNVQLGQRLVTALP